MVYRLTRSAEQDLINIYVEGCRKFGTVQADSYYTRLRETFELLSEFPRLARERIEFRPPVRIYGSGAHIVIYIIDDNNDLRILRIRHGREDWLNEKTTGE